MLFVNSSTGNSALDKAVLEAMACELPVISSNEQFLEIFGPFKDPENLVHEVVYVVVFHHPFPQMLADALHLFRLKTKNGFYLFSQD